MEGVAGRALHLSLVCILRLVMPHTRRGEKVYSPCSEAFRENGVGRVGQAPSPAQEWRERTAGRRREPSFLSRLSRCGAWSQSSKRGWGCDRMTAQDSAVWVWSRLTTREGDGVAPSEELLSGHSVAEKRDVLSRSFPSMAAVVFHVLIFKNFFNWNTCIWVIVLFFNFIFWFLVEYVFSWHL